MVSKIWVGMFTTNIHLLKFKVTCKNDDLEFWNTSEFIQKKNCLKLLNTSKTFAIFFIFLIKIPPLKFWSLLLKVVHSLITRLCVEPIHAPLPTVYYNI